MIVLAACSSNPSGDVSHAAQDFYAAVAARDGQAICALLSSGARTEVEQSSGKTCAEAVLEENLPKPSHVDPARVYGTMAIVHAQGDTMFLGRFPTGWLVTSVGCQSSHESDRYDCAVAGS